MLQNDLKVSYITKQKTPLLMEPRNIHNGIKRKELLYFIKSNRQLLLTSLNENGAILFRDFDLLGVEDFSEFYMAFTGREKKDYDYSGGISPRTKLSDGVYTSTEWANYLKISLHNELSYHKKYPRYIMFHCVRPANKGGVTPIADCRKVIKSLRPDTLQKFDRYGITYKRYYYKKNFRIDVLNKVARVHKTWMEVFDTQDRDEVEEKCRLRDYQFRWDKSGGIYIDNTLPACVYHPDSKEKVWFNQVHTFNAYRRNIGTLGAVLNQIFYPTEKYRVHNATFGNGEPIPKEDIINIHDAFDANTSAFPWKSGDILLLDNILTAHGRTAYTGPRKILTAMSNEVIH